MTWKGVVPGVLIMTMTDPALVQGFQPVADTPVAPIPARTLYGDAQGIRLENSMLDVVVLPSVGRIAEIRFRRGDNLLRLDTGLIEREINGVAGPGWKNMGGDWFWPVAQERWKAIAGADWPPPEFLASDRWTGRGWVGADGAHHARLEREYGAPIHVKAVRHIILDPDRPLITVHQRLERTEESDVPVTLWNISQALGITRAVLPVDADSAFPSGYAVLAFTPPPPDLVQPCEGTVEVNIGAGTEHKLGSDSKRAWIAGEKDGVVILERATTTAEGTYPDKGSRVTLYANTGLGYTEIETLSPELDLAPGEVLENKVTIDVFSLAGTNEACSVSDALRMRLGEKRPQAVRSVE